MSDTNKYEIQRGSHRTADGERKTVGDIVELTPSQAASFSDEKFQPLHESDPRDDSDDSVDADEVESDTSEPDGDGDDTEVDASIPDDYNELQSIATTYDGPEVDGRSSKDDIQSFLESMPAEDVIALKKAAN